MEAARALSALGHKTRLAIFRILVQAGLRGVAAGDIARELDLAPNALSFHLKDLAHAGLIASRQEGRYLIYSANFPSMNAVVAGFPRSWQTAPSITAICAGRSRSSIRCRAASMTMSVWTQTSPSGCHSGSCGTSLSAFSSGKSWSIAPSSRSHFNPIEGRCAANRSFSTSPQMRSAGKSESSIDRQSSIVCGSIWNSKRPANCAARNARKPVERPVRFPAKCHAEEGGGSDVEAEPLCLAKDLDFATEPGGTSLFYVGGENALVSGEIGLLERFAEQPAPDAVFGLPIPESVPGVPGEVLHPRSTWTDLASYDAQAHKLARLFRENDAGFEMPAAVREAGPRV